MLKLDSNSHTSSASVKFCAVLPLSSPPTNWSAIDWYYKKICGVPFLKRNIINIQRAGADFLIIYSNTENTALYRRLYKESGISIKLIFESDIAKVIKVSNDYSILILNSEALYTKQEIELSLNFKNQSNEAFVHPIDPENLAEAINQISLGNKVSVPRLSSDKNSRVNFLSGKSNTYINTPRDFLIQQKNLLQSSGLENDSFMDKTITRFFSRQLTSFFLKTPLSPNMITILSLFIGLLSAIFFIQGTHQNNMIGAGFLLLSAWVDCTDGEVARLKFLESKIGGKLDIICDNLVHFAVFFSIGIGLYQSTGDNIFVLIGSLAVFGSLISFLLLSSSIIDKKEIASTNKAYPKKTNTLTDNMANRDFIYLLFFMSLIGRVDIFIYITAFGSNIFAAYLTCSKIKSSWNKG
jgi:phosphatidylglycerophosphate synthase